ncbi:aminoglycoside N(3)-acetyltransferase [Halobacillus sp. H74]|uniref:aminoglycoside N(3)-acetyltransferase n=1 Tax=Halobacillus sp. H74 TaxID=3457436 RepID=UPI003FCCB904
MSQELRTRESIRNDLLQLGVEKGSTVLVHSSLSSLDWVNGGAVAVNLALMDVVTEEGTIVMPSQSDDMSDPTDWSQPPVPEEWVPEILETMPAYHPDYTPASRMGKVVEVFRTFPDVSRSTHPLYSFAAWGKNKDEILTQHSAEFGLGEKSPLQRLYDMDAHVLFIGSDFDACTCFHLAEYRLPNQKTVIKGAPVLKDGGRVWQKFEDIEFQEERFQSLGEAFEQVKHVTKGQVGSAECRLFSIQEAVDYAEAWLNFHIFQEAD